ncbi:MAG TPA: helical backbone metal receptor [Acidisarcina sp.]|nr:helical backbone metal receptor [Acidisarcina sp.]
MKRLLLLLLLLVFLSPATCVASRTLTDELGRTVVVPDHPHKLVCLAPSIVDDVYSLGAGSDVIAVSEYTTYPAEAAKKQTIGAPLNPSLEKIIALHPDLILGTGGMNRIPAIDQLARYGIPVFMVNPHGIDGIHKSIASLGNALNRQSEAAALLRDLGAREQAVRVRIHGKPLVRIFMPVWYDPIVTIGRHAFLTELIEVAGGSSITDDIAQEWPQVSLEVILARQPDALLLIRNSKFSLAELANKPGWQALKPVREGRVFYVDQRIELPSPAAIYAMEDLAKQLHP